MPRLRSGAVAALAALLLFPLGAPSADAAPKKKQRKVEKSSQTLDRELVAIIQQRDRGELEQASAALRALIAKKPDAMSAHLLYQEVAAVSRRNGPLVEAEYRHWLDQDPDDARRMVLHAAATLTAALTTADYLNRDRIKAIERSLAAAEIDDDASSWAHLIYAEVEQVRRRMEEVRDRLLKSVDADPGNFAARGDLITARAALKEWEQAGEACIELLTLAPWRAPHCGVVIPEKVTTTAGATPEQQERIAALLEQLEGKHAQDAIVLQALWGLYDTTGNKPGVRRVAAALTALGPWTPPLKRNPYLEPLPDGDLGEEEVTALERIQTIIEANKDHPRNHAGALVAHEPELPESPRIRAIYWRLRSHALRHPDVNDRDASRAAIKIASDLQSQDAQLLNEWAYMSALDKVDLTEALAGVEKALEMLLGAPFNPIQIEPGETYAEWAAGAGESAGAFLDTRGWILYQLGRFKEAERDLHLASTLTADGTVQGHLGRVRYALGNDEGAFVHLLRALALGCEEEEEVRKLASHIYSETHVIAGGLDTLVNETHRQILNEMGGAPARAVPADDDEAEAAPVEDNSSGRNTFGSDSDHRLLGKAAPNITIQRIGGGMELMLDDLDGQVVVLDFWATWCGPCTDALPTVEALSRAFEGQPVTFVMASVDDNLGVIERFWSDRDAPIQVGLVQGDGAEQFGVRGIPAMFLIDKDGTVIGHHLGFEAGEHEELAATLAWLVSRP